MKTLEKRYNEALDKIGEEIQASEELAQFLDTEEEEDYKALLEAHENKMHELYTTVAQENPLQLLDLEVHMLDQQFEGLYLPKLFAYALLRGSVNEDYHYKRPQEHLSLILQTICSSVNFDLIKTRIGQAVQVCFAISSDIWVTEFINQFTSKSLRQFLKSKRLAKFRHPKERKMAYQAFKAQFVQTNFYTARIPENLADLFNQYDKIVDFLHYRIQYGLSHDPYEADMAQFLSNTEWAIHKEYRYILVLALSFIEFSDKNAKEVKKLFTTLRKDVQDFNAGYFAALEKGLENQRLYFDFATDKRLFKHLDASIEDDILKYYSTTAEVATKGFVHEDTIELVRKNYNAHEGLSRFNECLRYSILGHFTNVLTNLEVSDYAEYFELNKVFVLYINIFDNQLFNQHLKSAIVKYVRRGLKVFTDKRGRDYQEIKKFVISSFTDMAFMNEKELKEFFKTKRKPKKPSSTSA